jgi:hypothetical protein
MKNKKASGLFWLVLLCMLIFAVSFLFRSHLVQKLLKIETQAEIFVEINDETSCLVSLLKSKSDELSYLDAMACYDGSQDSEEIEKEINETVDKMDISVILYDEKGDVKAIFGRRRLGDLVYAELPLPGGNSRVIGLMSDVEMQSMLNFPGGEGGETGGGGAGGRW